MKFEYVYLISAIDFWDGAQIADRYETEAVLNQMPETRDDIVYKLYLPCPGSSSILPVYLCKADNNGTTYIFSRWNLKTGLVDELMY